MAKEVLEMEIKSNTGQVTKDVNKLDDATKKASGGFKGISTAIKGIGTAFKAAGIGLLVGLLAKMMEVFSKNQKVVDAFDLAMASLSIAFNDLFNFLSNNVGKVTGWFKELFEDPKQKLVDFGDAVKENLIERFNSFLESVGFLAEAFKKLFARDFTGALESAKNAGSEWVDVFTGVDGTLGKVTTALVEGGEAMVNYGKKTLKSADAVVELAKASREAIAVNQGLIEQYDREAELQRQIRDDESKTFAQRLEANRELGSILKDQEKAMLDNADIMIAHAQSQKNILDNEENRIALQEAQNEKAAILAQITGFESEQMVNRVALEKELAETKREIALEGTEGVDRELLELEQSYEQRLELARKAGVDQTEITQQYWNQVGDIIDAELQKEIDAEKKAADEKLAIDNAVKAARSNMAISGLKLVEELAGEGTNLAKGAAVAQATVSGIEGVQNAYTTAQKSPFTVLFPAYPIVQAGLAAAFSALQIQKILSVSDTGGGGGGSAGVGGGGGGGTPAPQMMSGSFNLTGGVAPEPVQAFVVTDEMTNSQNQLANIRRRSTL